MNPLLALFSSGWAPLLQSQPMALLKLLFGRGGQAGQGQSAMNPLLLQSLMPQKEPQVPAPLPSVGLPLPMGSPGSGRPAAQDSSAIPPLLIGALLKGQTSAQSPSAASSMLIGNLLRGRGQV